MGTKMKGFLHFKPFVLAVLCMLCGFAVSKECSNTHNLTPTDDSAWASLLPRKVLKDQDEYSWAMTYRKMKNPSKSSVDFLKEVPLHDVRLLPGSIHWTAQETNLKYLLMLDVDRLVWSFRKTAGLHTTDKPYGGWEAPNIELRGHFVGHYLSATARMWASTHNETVKEKMSALVTALYECQDEIGNGYLSAFPTSFFDRFEDQKSVWAPYYTIHKIMAGLLDQYLFAHNAKALKMVKWMADYFYDRVHKVLEEHTVAKHYKLLDQEVGGMNDVLYNLYTVTNNTKLLTLAHLFDKPSFLGPLAFKADEISGLHANTHIPVIIGSQRRYEVTNDPLYRVIGTNFMDIVNSSHSYATGGTSVHERWTEPKRLADHLEKETEETCSTYNMLKVSRHLFKWTKDAAYADYYERALTNGVLSIQRGTEPGVMIYMLQLKPGGSKAKSYHGWGKPFDSSGAAMEQVGLKHTYNSLSQTIFASALTNQSDSLFLRLIGIESFSKLGDSIYFEGGGKKPGLYVIQYISSSLHWKSGQTVITQKVDLVLSTRPYLRVTFTFSSKQGTNRSSTLNLRIPIWTHSDGAKALLNGRGLKFPNPGKFLSITSKWGNEDVLTLKFPISLRTEAIKDDRSKYASVHAILYGPYLLAGLTNDVWKMKLKPSKSLLKSINPVPTSYNDHLVTFSQQLSENTLVVVTDQSTNSIQVQGTPKSGTDPSVRATFRLIYFDSSNSTSNHSLNSTSNIIGKRVKLEPFDLPGVQLIEKGKYRSLSIANATNITDHSSTFQVVSGLNGKNGTISLESVRYGGCYVFNDSHFYKQDLSLGCKTDTSSSNDKFSEAVSFVMKNGLSKYHPISFIAEANDRKFLLAPLLSFRDVLHCLFCR